MKPIPPVYLADSVYAQFSNHMIGLSLDSHENLPLVWLERRTYELLKHYAKGLGWEPPDVLPEELPQFSNITEAIKNEVSTSTRRLSSWLQNQPLYLDIYQDLITYAHLKEASFTWDTWDLNVLFSGTGEHLAQVFRVLRTRGFKLEGRRPKAKASSWMGRFIKDETRIYIMFSSTVCQLKQVRTELKEVPIYDIVCGEGVSSEDQAELQGNSVSHLTQPTPDLDDDIPL